MSENIVKKIEKIVTPVIEEMDLSLVEVEYLQDGGYWYVRIFVERIDGEITLEECAKISSEVDEEIDKLIEQKFFLEVSSPGIERPLKKIEDFIRFSGEKVKVSLKHKLEILEDKKGFEGFIVEIKGENIIFEIDEKLVEIPFKEIKKSNLVYDFEEF